MIQRTKGLDFADELYRKGIMPHNFEVHSIDYSKVKKGLKKQVGIIAKVTTIKFIFNRINDEIITALIKDKSIETIDVLGAAQIISNNAIKENIENSLGKPLSQMEFDRVINIIIRSTDLFKKEVNLRNYFFRTQMDWIGDKYLETKLSLDDLFCSELTTYEYHLILETWCHYICLAKDLMNPDNYVQEQLKEINDSLTNAISSYSKAIHQHQLFLEGVQSLERITKIDLKSSEDHLKTAQQNIQYLNSVKNQFHQNYGSELNPRNIETQAFFSIFFLGELLGLEKPKRNKDSNPLLTLLITLHKWSHPHLEEYTLRKRASSYFENYTKFKSDPHVQQPLENLIKMTHPKGDLESIMELFRADILNLIIQSKDNLITQDD
ncbi:hypothetical protein [Legionella bozemanae]|uniref:hypothetical protein n=1 Tax=Legionella bozemanae TaxID=447 RepID=UPI0010415E27|nr:hypothetical protein [Legionella bozemanae]